MRGAGLGAAAGQAAGDAGQQCKAAGGAGSKDQGVLHMHVIVELFRIMFA